VFPEAVENNAMSGINGSLKCSIKCVGNNEQDNWAAKAEHDRC
jgi:hypothetical protein